MIKPQLLRRINTPGTMSSIRSISQLHKTAPETCPGGGTTRNSGGGAAGAMGCLVSGAGEGPVGETGPGTKLHSVPRDALWEALLRPKGVLLVKLEVIWNIEMRNSVLWRTWVEGYTMMIQGLSIGVADDHRRRRKGRCISVHRRKTPAREGLLCSFFWLLTAETQGSGCRGVPMTSQVLKT